MTKRSARKMVRLCVDDLHGRGGVPTCSAERAYGMVQRRLAVHGVDLDFEERLELMAYAHGYVTGQTGIVQDREPAIAVELEQHADAYDAGLAAGSRA